MNEICKLVEITERYAFSIFIDLMITELSSKYLRKRNKKYLKRIRFINESRGY